MSSVPDRLQTALARARQLGETLPFPAEGRTHELWAALSDLGGESLSVARVVEPHLDARHILHEAERHDDFTGSHEVWGVFAAEGPGTRLRAHRDAGGWSLSGRKPWCSLAEHLDRAVVTAWVDDTARGLFAVDLRHPGVTVVHEPWVARGLIDIVSGPIDLDDVPADPVGAPGWYLDRPGFVWGGIGVAAIWFGAARALGLRLTPVEGGRPPDQIALMHLGRVDVALASARLSLGEAADLIDAAPVGGDRARRLASRVRSTVALAAEAVLEATAHGLGPGPLVRDDWYAAATADLHLYLRQWHAERDLAALGAVTARHTVGGPG